MSVYGFFYFFFFKQKTAYEMRISDWSSDVCSSDLPVCAHRRSRFRPDRRHPHARGREALRRYPRAPGHGARGRQRAKPEARAPGHGHGRRKSPRRRDASGICQAAPAEARRRQGQRSEEHTSELQSIMSISYAVFRLKKKTKNKK